MSGDEGFTIELETDMADALFDKLMGLDKDRPAILQLAVPIYEHEKSRYPERIRVSFKDGHTEVYEIRAEQPAPIIMENIQIIRKWKQGYVNQPARRRRRK